jgi:hypothetical protein
MRSDFIVNKGISERASEEDLSKERLGLRKSSSDSRIDKNFEHHSNEILPQILIVDDNPFNVFSL